MSNFLFFCITIYATTTRSKLSLTTFIARSIQSWTCTWLMFPAAVLTLIWHMFVVDHVLIFVGSYLCDSLLCLVLVLWYVYFSPILIALSKVNSVCLSILSWLKFLQQLCLISDSLSVENSQFQASFFDRVTKSSSDCPSFCL